MITYRKCEILFETARDKERGKPLGYLLLKKEGNHFVFANFNYRNGLRDFGWFVRVHKNNDIEIDLMRSNGFWSDGMRYCGVHMATNTYPSNRGRRLGDLIVTVGEDATLAYEEDNLYFDASKKQFRNRRDLEYLKPKKDVRKMLIDQHRQERNKFKSQLKLKGITRKFLRDIWDKSDEFDLNDFEVLLINSMVQRGLYRWTINEDCSQEYLIDSIVKGFNKLKASEREEYYKDNNGFEVVTKGLNE